MRRDYFTCVFLLYVAVSLSFVCLLPSYFVYGEIIPREIGLIERIASLVVSICAIVIIPLFSAIRKKLWITIGASAYGILAYLPEMLITKMDSVLAGETATTTGVVQEFLLKAIYTMVNAPYAGITKLVGDKTALLMPKLILPVSVLSYILIQLFRFYRQAYIAEQLLPVADATHKVESPKAAARKPEILGTVISAPVKPKTNTGSASSQTQVHQTVNPSQVKQAQPTQPAQQAASSANQATVSGKTNPAPKAVEGNKVPAPKAVTSGDVQKPIQLDKPEEQLRLNNGQKVIYAEAASKPAEPQNETRVINLGAPATPVVKPASVDKPAPSASAPVKPAADVKPSNNPPVRTPVIKFGDEPVVPSSRNEQDMPVIQLDAPVKKASENSEMPVIQLGAPVNSTNDGKDGQPVIQLGAPVSNWSSNSNQNVIQLGSPDPTNKDK